MAKHPMCVWHKAQEVEVAAFWKRIQRGAIAAQISEARRGNAQSWQSGTYRNPIRLSSDAWASVLNLFFSILQGRAGLQVPNPTAPDPLKDGMMANSIRQNVRPGQWFYFSTMPDFIFLWNGSNIETAYDRKHNQWHYYTPQGVEFRDGA